MSWCLCSDIRVLRKVRWFYDCPL